ncbi:conserved hypothetical protein [Gammaproteobacteria bacterium]
MGVMQTETTSEKNTTSEMICVVPWQVTKVKSLEDYKLEVVFIDGTHGFVEMGQRIMNPKAGVFASLSDINLFNQVYLEYGAVTWPNEIDLAPDAMHDEIKRNGVWVLK